MRLSTRVHGVLDYLVGVLLIAAPWILGLPRGGPVSWVLMAAGAAALIYSFFTDYELGVVRSIQMPVHLWLDGIGGLLVALSPWIFAFDDTVYLPHLAVGIFEIAVALVSNTIPGYDRRQGARTTTR
jgi:hypothetical protein